MQYEVRYLGDGEEHVITIDAETAAAAAQSAQDHLRAGSADGSFELIQVQLMEPVDEFTTPANDVTFDPHEPRHDRS